MRPQKGRGKEFNMPMLKDRKMTTQTGQSDYARHARQRGWSKSHQNGRGGGNRK